MKISTFYSPLRAIAVTETIAATHCVVFISSKVIRVAGRIVRLVGSRLKPRCTSTTRRMNTTLRSWPIRRRSSQPAAPVAIGSFDWVKMGIQWRARSTCARIALIESLGTCSGILERIQAGERRWAMYLHPTSAAAAPSGAGISIPGSLRGIDPREVGDLVPGAVCARRPSPTPQKWRAQAGL